MHTLDIYTFNINGLRAGIHKGFLEWLGTRQPDIIALQEVKALPEQIPIENIEKLGYRCFWHPAEKKGYSGVAVFSRLTPMDVAYGIGIHSFDREGRVMRLDFDKFSLLNAYFPSGTTGEIRQAVKYEFLDAFYDHVESLRRQIPNLLVCGDYNICHREIDIHNPKQNANSSGFLPEERAWMDKYFQSGMVDTFRAFDKRPDQYSWWTYRAGAREKNKGWRIDYIAATEALMPMVEAAGMQPEVMFSDHCPVWVRLKV